MTKIFDLIDFHPGYGEQVRLLEYYYDEDLNLEHMRGYVPIRSHRSAFLDLARAQLPLQPKEGDELKGRTFMLGGSYGTGKSHLCLMLANYFSLKKTDPTMQEFFSNWAKRDPVGAANIQNWRGDGRYLVAPCDFAEANQFDEMLLNALERALKEEGAESLNIDTQFKGALSWIKAYQVDEQEGKDVGTFITFLNCLGGDDPRQSLEQLVVGLNQNLNTAMNQFQEVYQKATKSKMQFKNNNLLDVLEDLLKNKEFQRRYKGLVFLADEFGYALSEGRVSMAVFQGFAEMSKDGVDGMQLIFIGTGHRRFQAYGANTAWQQDAKVVEDRVVQVSLEAEELEQIISSLISAKKESPIWMEDVIGKNDWLLGKMAGGASQMKLFNYLDEPGMLEQIVKNIYPVHPMATYCLTRMSKELGSAARSVFSFFRKFGENSPERGYSWFVRNHEVTRPGGELNIYTPDLLAVYFKSDIASHNLVDRPDDRVRDLIRNYQAAVEEARRFAYKNLLSREIDPFTQKVLDIIFVYRVSDVNITQATLEFGLNLYKPNDKKALTSELKSLLEHKILFQSPSGEYEFRRSNMVDLESLINAIKQDILNKPLDLAEKVSKLSEKKWDVWTDAKGHNPIYLADRRLLRVFTTYPELEAKYKQVDGTEIDFWDLQEQRRASLLSWNDRYEGVMVYVLCENKDEIQMAQKAAKSNHCATVIVGIPTSPYPIKDAIVNLMAIQQFMLSEDYGKLELQEKAVVDEMLGKENQKTGLVGVFMLARERYLEAKGLLWTREDGKTLVADPANEYDPADILINRLYTERNTISHDYINKSHPKSFSGGRDSALRDAVGKLVQLDKTIQIDHGEKDNRGEIRYLKLALAMNGVLTPVGDYVGNIANYELESDPAKYQAKFPGLSSLIEKLRSLKRGDILNIWPVLSEMTDRPFGLGPYSLALFFACAIRHFGDEIRLKINPTGLGYSDTSDPEIIIDMATGRFPQATLERRPLTPATAKLINEIYNLFASQPAAASTQQTLSEAWRAMQAWWKELTRLERAAGVYEDDSTTQRFIDFLTQNGESNTGSQVFIEQIKEIYGYANVELDDDQATDIIQKIKQDKDEIESRAETIKSAIVKQLSELFNPEGDTYQDYTAAINTWVKNLQHDQKLLTAEWQTAASRTVLEALQKLVDIEKTFLEVIPNANGFNLGKVDDWTYDQTDSYIKKFQNAKALIEGCIPTVPPPVFSTDPEKTIGFQGAWAVKYHEKAKLIVSSPGIGLKVRVTMNEDPILAKQFVPVEDTPEEIIITKSCTYFMVTHSGQNEWSKVVRVIFTNLDDENKLILEQPAKLDRRDWIYRFKNPADKVGLLVLLKDMVLHFRQDQLVEDPNILSALEETIRSEYEEKAEGVTE